MLTAIWIAVGLITLTFVILLIIIFAHRLFSILEQRRLKRRRAALEPKFLEFIHSDEPSVLAMLGGALPPKDRQPMAAILTDYAQRIRGVERERMHRVAEELGFVDRDLERLESRRWWSRAAAAERLGIFGASRAIPQLIEALEDEVPEVRLRAASALGLLGGRASIGPLIEAMDQPDRWSSIRIGDILAHMGNTVPHELLERFDSLSDAGKISALDILARLKPLNISDWLVERLDSESTDVRARACHALGAIGDRAAIPALRVAVNDEAWPVRAMAAKALGILQAKEGIPELCQLMSDREWWPRSNAANAIRQLGDPGIAALERMLSHEDAYARHQAVLMLEAAGEVDRAIERLDYSDLAVRVESMGFLQKVMDAGQTARLHELARVHRRADVRNALENLLGGALETSS